MLALMPQSPPLPDFRNPNHMGTNTMSVAVLPSAPLRHDQKALSTQTSASTLPSKRPKLSLNTSSVAPVFGKKSTSLRLETLSATSPTARNTFSNAQHQIRTDETKRRGPALTPLATSISASPTETTPPYQIKLPDSATSAVSTSSPTVSSASSTSTIEFSSEVPYKLSFNVKSILSNGPLPRTRNRRPSFTQSRPMFPIAKKVVFRAPLTEEIETSKYTLRHSDIEDPSLSRSTTPESSSGEEDEVEKDDDSTENPDESPKPSREDLSISSPLKRTKVDSDDEDGDDDSCPETPVAGRRKRHRQWVWTLGPVDGSSNAGAAADDMGEIDDRR